MVRLLRFASLSTFLAIPAIVAMIDLPTSQRIGSGGY
jgi:hypothetical protein